MPTSGAASLASSLSALDAAQAVLSAQVGVQRDVLDLQQQVAEQLFAQLLQQVGIGVNINLTG